MTKSAPAPAPAPRRARLWMTLGVAGLLAIVAFVVSTGGGGADTGAVDAGGQLDGADGEGGRGPQARRATGKLDLLSVERASISGTVTDASGQPIAGARVCARGSSPDVGREQLRFPTCSRAEDDGHYRISGLLPIRYDVDASAPEYQPAHWKPHPNASWNEQRIWLAAREDRSGIDIVLKAGGARIAGVVRDLAGGTIEGAWVSSDGAFAVSDQDGAFELWTRPHRGWLGAKAEGYNDFTMRVATPSEGNEIYLTPESVLVGRVVRAGSTEGVGGVGIEVGGGFYDDAPAAVTEPDGSFRVGGLAPGRYQLEARADDLYGRAPSSVPLGLTEISPEVVIEVHPAASLEARVVIAGSDSPCPEGRVWLELVDGARQHQDRIGPSDAGNATVPAILPGKYKVKAACDRYLADEDYGELEVGTIPLAPMRIEVREGLSIRGEVVDAEGRPVAEAYLRASPKMVEGADARAHQTQTAERSRSDGSFELLGLLPGRYEIKCWGGEGSVGKESPVEVELSAGADRNDLVITVDAQGAVSGTVRDEHGTPMRDLQIVAEAKRSGGWSFGGSSSGVSDGEGRFEIAALKVGEYRVIAKRGFLENLRRPGQGDDDPDGEPVTVRAGERSEVDLVVERSDGEITGRVVAGGGPVSDAFINYTRISESEAASAKSRRNSVRWGNWGQRPILTDADGSFVVSGLSPGRYVVQATRKGGGEGIVEEVSLGEEVVIEIAETASVSGRVVSGDSALARGLEVKLRDEGRGLYFSESTFASEGRFEFLEVPAGDYELEASTDLGRAKTAVTVEAGAAVSGIELELESLVAVTGRVVDLRTGAPVPGISVGVVPRGSWGMRSKGGTKDNISDAEGRFELRKVPTGKVTITAGPRTWGGGTPKYAYFRRHTALPPGEATVDIGDLKLVENRVDEKSEVGDLGFKVKDADPDEEEEARELAVAFVRPGGPAAAAGLEVGATIVEVDGVDVTGGSTYFQSLTRVEVGTELTLGLADGKAVKITAGPRP